MTTEEKLQHFLDTCMEDARTKSARIMDDYTASLEHTFQEHQEDAKSRAEMQIRLESEKIKREINKRLSMEHLNIKRTLGKKQDELKDKLFVELKDMLANFLETPEYQTLLEGQISQAVSFAGVDNVVIYLDPADGNMAKKLAPSQQNVQLRVSEYSFGGGCRAVIASRHILIDHSFETKLSEAKASFHFHLDTETGGKD